MRKSCEAGANRRLLGLVAVYCAVMLGCFSGKTLAQQPVTLDFTGACTDCIGNGNLALTIPSFVSGDQTTYSGTAVSVTYSSSILGNLTSAPGDAEVFAGTINTEPTSPTPEFMEIQFGTLSASGAYTPYTFTSCGTSTVYLAGAANQTHDEICGSAADVSNGIATLAYGSWEVDTGVFQVSGSEPAGGGHTVQNDIGTNGLWSIAPAVVAAPEIDPASAMGAVVLLLGSLAVMGGRRRHSMLEL